MNKNMPEELIKSYQDRLINCMQSFDWLPVRRLVEKILSVRKDGGCIFLCGNGGSAVNAMHIVNDLLCLRSRAGGRGVNVTALPANQAILTGLANDIGYENIFSFQLTNLGKKGDLLIVLSGSGNSPNVLKALSTAKKIGIQTSAILGFDGGKCLELADIPIHFSINDMQIAEDLQLIVGHMLMQWLKEVLFDE